LRLSQGNLRYALKLYSTRKSLSTLRNCVAVGAF
jgi:hypothetical protein